MKRIVLIGVVIVILIVCVFIVFPRYVSVSTDKQVYSLGEKIGVTKTAVGMFNKNDFSLLRFFKKIDGNWVGIEGISSNDVGDYHPYPEVICLVDSNEGGTAELGYDLAMWGKNYMLPFVEFIIGEKSIISKGCSYGDISALQPALGEYFDTNVPVGEYKIRYFGAETQFEIK